MRTLKISFFLILFCGCLFSCTKEEPETGETAEISVQPSGICGTWEWQAEHSMSLQPQEGDFLRITFREHSYKVESNYLLCYDDTCIQHLCQFYNHEQGNYKIEDGKFYRWHVTPLPNFAEIPCQEGIEPIFNVTMDNDTMRLEYLFAQYQSGIQYPNWFKLVRVQ